MQLVMTAISVIGGMAFSLAIAILAEELIFGKIFSVLFIRQAIPVEDGRPRPS